MTQLFYVLSYCDVYVHASSVKQKYLQMVATVSKISEFQMFPIDKFNKSTPLYECFEQPSFRLSLRQIHNYGIPKVHLIDCKKMSRLMAAGKLRLKKQNVLLNVTTARTLRNYLGNRSVSAYKMASSFLQKCHRQTFSFLIQRTCTCTVFITGSLLLMHCSQLTKKFFTHKKL